MTKTQLTWLRHIENQRSSGMSTSAYCKKHSLNPGTFSCYRSKLGREPPPKKKVPDFVPVVVDGLRPTPTKIRLLLASDIQLEFDESVPVERIANLISALRSAS